jgi:hypothetical protein
VRVNADPSVQALIPTVSARADGTIGVSYFDMRSNTSATATLLTDYWLATSRDGVSWTDRRISAAFDLATAPVARGYFVGDYMGLTNAGSNFYSFYVRTNSANAANRTDVFMTPVNVPTGTTQTSLSVRVEDVETVPVSAAYRQRVHDNILRKLEQRMPGIAKLKGVPGLAQP